MKEPAAVLTMVKDDYFFLAKWVEYYGGMFGRDALYVVSHGGDPQIDKIADGCNIIRIPGHFDKGFDSKRWRLLTGLTNGLRNYFDFVICCDVDEFIVLDPKSNMTLTEFLARRGKVIITPIGVEVVHRRDIEDGDIAGGILKNRRFCRYSSYFSKPCIVGKAVEFSRGGHYAKETELKVFRNLYLFHMKYCDYEIYRGTLGKRAEAVSKLGIDDPSESIISAHWFAEEDGFGEEIDRLAFMPTSESFDFSAQIDEMNKTWSLRNEKGLWHFQKNVGDRLYPIPDRFADIV